MKLLPESGIQVESFGNDVSYELPVRPLGGVRWLGIVPIGVGSFLLVTRAWTIFSLPGIVIAGRQEVWGWIGLAESMMLVVGGLVLTGIGVLMIWGRCRVNWRDGRLTVLEYAGPVRWARRLPRSRVRGFIVSRMGAESGNSSPASDPEGLYSMLTLDFGQEGSCRLVVGYPRDWLDGLAKDLSARMEGGRPGARAPRVNVVDSLQGQPRFEVDARKPPESRIELQSRFDGFLMTVPPAGWRLGMKGFLGVAIGCVVFLALFAGLPFFVMGSGTMLGKTPFGVLVGLFCIFGFFLVGGLAILTSAVNMYLFRRALLEVDGDGLRITRSGLFGTKCFGWRRGEIRAICVGGGNLTINEKSVLELQIHADAGRKYGFFAGRSVDELDWMAAELRKALKVPAGTV